MSHLLLCGNNFLLRKKRKSLVASTLQLIVFLCVQLLDGHLLFALNLVLMLGMKKDVSGLQSGWEKMSLVLSLTGSIISLCNHFKIDRIIHFLIFFSPSYLLFPHFSVIFP